MLSQAISKVRPSPSMCVSLLALIIALGGAGVAATGGNFILGRDNNTATTRSTLNASVPGVASLWLINNSTAANSTALALNVAAGKAPLKVNSAAKVANLNSDLLDGLSANSISRGTGASSNAEFIDDGRVTLHSVTLEVPQNGFVLLTGSATSAYFGGCSALCSSRLRFKDTVGSVITETATNSATGVQSSQTSYLPIATTQWLPVTRGTHTIELIGSWFGVAPTFYNPSLAVVFVPFNGAGTSAVTAQARPTATRMNRIGVAPDIRR